MDDAGNILVRRYARSNVYVKQTGGAAASASNGAKTEAENSISADILKLPGQALEADKVLKLFDMKKFQSNINRELRQAYPDRRRLELQCLSAVAFVRSEPEVLDCPVWVLIVNVVAMDLLKSKLPPSEYCNMIKSVNILLLDEALCVHIENVYDIYFFNEWIIRCVHLTVTSAFLLICREYNSVDQVVETINLSTIIKSIVLDLLSDKINARLKDNNVS